jgi:hypothetical protein
MRKIPFPFIVFTLTGMVLSLFSVTVFPARDGEPTPLQPAWVEPDVDRPGSDFKILWLRGGVEACQEACAQNPLCKSYTYVRAGVSGRLEGCWLKNGVPSPVEDGCCVSGVKSDETLSRFMREPLLAPRMTDTLPDGAKQEVSVPKPPPVETEVQEEKVPPTGSGKRAVEKMNYNAALPGSAIARRNTVPVAVPPFVPVVGTGRKEVKGMDFAAADPATAGRMERAATATTAGASRNGRRDIRGVTYTASPSPGRKLVAEPRREGAATRNVTGVNIKAVPPQR